MIVLCHGGPIAEPSDVAEVFRTTRGIAGFFGASSVERLPTEPAIVAQVRAFGELKPPTGREMGGGCDLGSMCVSTEHRLAVRLRTRWDDRHSNTSCRN